MDGETYYSKECVIFLNSVSNIVNIVKQTELLPDEVNIIVGSSEENDKSIAKLGNGFQRGRIPLKGETHKNDHLFALRQHLPGVISIQPMLQPLLSVIASVSILRLIFQLTLYRLQVGSGWLVIRSESSSHSFIM